MDLGLRFKILKIKNLKIKILKIVSKNIFELPKENLKKNKKN